MNKVIDEKTKIPIGIAAAIIVLLIPLCVWAFRVEYNSHQGAKAYRLYHRIDKRLDRIEIKLGTKPDDDILDVEDEDR